MFVCVCEHANEEGGEPAPHWAGRWEAGREGGGVWRQTHPLSFPWHGLRRPAGDVIHLAQFGVGAKCVSGPWS